MECIPFIALLHINGNGLFQCVKTHLPKATEMQKQKQWNNNGEMSAYHKCHAIQSKQFCDAIRPMQSNIVNSFSLVCFERKSQILSQFTMVMPILMTQMNSQQYTHTHGAHKI